MGNIKVKTPKEIAIMREGGHKLAIIRDRLASEVKPGVSAWDIDQLAEELILQAGAKPSFQMVPGYSWSTCINVNDGVVHGIPYKDVVFAQNDIVSVDVGVYFEGFHTDTATTVYLGKNSDVRSFWNTGKQALLDGIAQVQEGNTIGDISLAIQTALKRGKTSAIRDLTGHGVGRQLHEAPSIPCFVTHTPSDAIRIEPGFVLAVEVMYTLGTSDIVIGDDGWTIRTKDGTIAALFEETVAVTSDGAEILTSA
jgi:methionyl aminopeptidase